MGNRDVCRVDIVAIVSNVKITTDSFHLDEFNQVKMNGHYFCCMIASSTTAMTRKCLIGAITSRWVSDVSVVLANQVYLGWMIPVWPNKWCPEFSAFSSLLSIRSSGHHFNIKRHSCYNSALVDYSYVPWLDRWIYSGFKLWHETYLLHEQIERRWAPSISAAHNNLDLWKWTSHRGATKSSAIPATHIPR